jgi:ribokinase
MAEVGYPMTKNERPVILVAGAINTDLVAMMDRAPEAGETITGRSFAIHGGGKAANQAVAAARSGAKVALVGSVGADDFGTARLADLRNDGIDVDWVRINADVSSGVALILVDESGENRIAYIPAATLTVPLEHGLRALDATDPAYILAANELPNEALDALFRQGQAAGVAIAFNAAPDPEAARNLVPHVSILIVNQGEVAALAGNDISDLSALAGHLGSEFGCSVVLTAGADGAYAWHEGVAFHIPGEHVEVVDTTGAGDTFCGALVAELATGAGFEEAVAYGVKAASLSVQRAGAQSSIPTRNEVEPG